MSVLITGVTGYLGSHIAQLFVSEGWTVYGLTRSEEKSKSLASKFIVPVIGTMQDFSKALPILDKVSVVVHCAFDMTDPMSFGKWFKSMEDYLSIPSDTLVKNLQKKHFFYTSGAWIYGSHKPGHNVWIETDPIDLNGFLGKRVYQEKPVLSSKVFHGTVLRPPLIYGGHHGMFSRLVHSPSMPFYGDANGTWALVHVQDLARAFLFLAKLGGPSTAGEIYNVVGHHRTKKPLILALRNALGIDESATKFVPADADNFLANGLALSQKISCHKLENLGWEHAHDAPDAHPELYAAAWKSQFAEEEEGTTSTK